VIGTERAADSPAPYRWVRRSSSEPLLKEA
jgi:hypothetical protein